MPANDEPWFHPLTGQRQVPLNRRRLFLLGGSGVASAVIARPVVQQRAAAQGATPSATPQATPAADTITGDDDAIAALRGAAQAMSALETFAFDVETTRGSSSIAQGLDVKSITGAVRRPTDFTAAVTVSVPLGDLTFSVVSVDGKIWAQNPLEGSGAWTEVTAAAEITSLVNPDALILSSINILQEAKVDGTEKLDGQETTVISGTVDFETSAKVVAGGDVDLPAAIAPEPIDVLVWIDAEYRVVEIELSGPILIAESEDVVRVVSFSAFNEPVDIQAPPV